MLEDPAAPPDEVLEDPVLDDPVLDDPVLDDPVLDDPVLDDPVLDDPVLDDPVLDDPVPDEVLPVGLALVPPGAGELDARETGVEGLALTDVDAAAGALGLAVLDGVGVEQGVPVAVAGFLLPVALVLAFAEAVVVPLLVAVAVTLAVAVAVPVAVPLALALALSLELVLPLAGLSLGLPLVLPPGGLVTGVAGAGVALGVTDLDGLAAADDEEVDWQAVGVPLLWPAEVRPRLAPPPDELAGVPDPATLAPPLALEEENPTAEPSWTKASRSGGTAKETPIANTAQATARAGRSSPYRQSRGCRPAPPVPAPPVPAPPVPAASCPPRMAFQRCTRSARKPRCTEAHACLLA